MGVAMSSSALAPSYFVWSKSDRKGQMSYEISYEHYMWNLKKSCKNELIYKTEIESQI